MIFEANISERHIEIVNSSPNIQVALEQQTINRTIEVTPLPTNYSRPNANNNGWAEYINTQLYYNTDIDNNGIALPQGVWVDLPLRDDSGLKTQQTVALDGMIDSNTNEIISNNKNDYFLARFDFKVKTELANRRGELEFYIPNTSISFNNVKFSCADDASEIERPFIPLPFFTGWIEPTRARIRIRIIDGNGDLYGVGLQLKQMYRGENI